jgi:hypothetical protein
MSGLLRWVRRATLRRSLQQNRDWQRAAWVQAKLDALQGLTPDAMQRLTPAVQGLIRLADRLGALELRCYARERLLDFALALYDLRNCVARDARVGGVAAARLVGASGRRLAHAGGAVSRAGRVGAGAASRATRLHRRATAGRPDAHRAVRVYAGAPCPHFRRLGRRAPLGAARPRQRATREPAARRRRLLHLRGGRAPRARRVRPSPRRLPRRHSRERASPVSARRRPLHRQHRAGLLDDGTVRGRAAALPRGDDALPATRRRVGCGDLHAEHGDSAAARRRPRGRAGAVRAGAATLRGAGRHRRRRLLPAQPRGGLQRPEPHDRAAQTAHQAATLFDRLQCLATRRRRRGK